MASKNHLSAAVSATIFCFRNGIKAAGRDEAEYLEELVRNHVSGRLKVAPEHTSPECSVTDEKSSL